MSERGGEGLHHRDETPDNEVFLAMVDSLRGRFDTRYHYNDVAGCGEVVLDNELNTLRTRFESYVAQHMSENHPPDEHEIAVILTDLLVNHGDLPHGADIVVGEGTKFYYRHPVGKVIEQRVVPPGGFLGGTYRYIKVPRVRRSVDGQAHIAPEPMIALGAPHITSGRFQTPLKGGGKPVEEVIIPILQPSVRVIRQIIDGGLAHGK